MDGHTDPTTTPTPKAYKSRPGALVWFFRKSRDGWKRKYQDLKATVKGLKNRIADLTRSREHWRAEAERATSRLTALESELAGLRARVEAPAEKKTTEVPVR